MVSNSCKNTISGFFRDQSELRSGLALTVLIRFVSDLYDLPQLNADGAWRLFAFSSSVQQCVGKCRTGVVFAQPWWHPYRGRST